MNNKSRWIRSADVAAIGSLLVGVAVRLGSPVANLAVESHRLPQWDMAKYGVSGLRLARSLSDFDLPSFLRQMNALDVWPPLFPLVEAMCFLVFGPDYSVARGLVAALFVIAIGTSFWAGSASSRQTGILAGALAASLLATSPIVHLFGTLIMLELPGTVLLLASVGWYFKSLDSGRSRDFLLACVFSTALFFCKYNYGLLWLLPMATNEVLRRLEPDVSRVRTLFLYVRKTVGRPWSLFIFGIVLTAVLIKLGGPWQFNFGNRTVRISSAANLVYGAYALFLLWRLLRPLKSWRSAREAFFETSQRTRTMVLVIGLPIALWMAVPAHTINFVRFMENRSTGPPILSFEALSFYPRVFINQYSLNSVVGISMLAIAFVSLRRLRGTNEKGRVLALALLFSVLALVAHPYKLPRFGFITATLLWIVTSKETAEAFAWVIDRFPAVGRQIVVGCAAAAILMAAAVSPVDQKRLERDHRKRTVSSTTRPVIDSIANQAEDSAGSVLLGTWNELSPFLVQWHCLLKKPDIERWQIPRHLVGRKRRGNVVGYLAGDPGSEAVMVLSATLGSALHKSAYSDETSWLKPVRKSIARDPRFQLVNHVRFTESGYELDIYLKEN